jgi:hypothetical protein
LKPQRLGPDLDCLPGDDWSLLRGPEDLDDVYRFVDVEQARKGPLTEDLRSVGVHGNDMEPDPLEVLGYTPGGFLQVRRSTDRGYGLGALQNFSNVGDGGSLHSFL